jgi:hypothetical protein
MSSWSVVVVTKGLDAAAAREAAAFAAQLSSEQQREIQQAVREAAQEARVAAQEAARAGIEARAAARQAPGAPQVPDLPGMPKVTVDGDGKMTIVSPEGSTTIVEPGGRVVTVDRDGQVTHSSPLDEMGDQGLPPGGEVTMIGLSALLAFFAGRWWASRAFRRRAPGQPAAGALPAEMDDRMQRIEQAVEAVAIEVERVSEGQRFTTKLLSEMRTSPLAVSEPRS